MKGVVPLVLAVLLVSLIVEGVMLTNFVVRTETFRRAIRETEITTAINLMELTKRSLEQSLTYSFYQASYVVAKNGGYNEIPSTVKTTDNMPYWRIYDDTSGFPTNYSTNLAKKTNTYFDYYKSSLALKDLSIPEYEITIEKKNDKALVTASTTGKLQYYVPSFYNISDDAASSKSYEIRILDFFESGKTKFVDQDSIKDKITEAVNQFTTNHPNCKRVDVGDSCSLSNANDTLNHYCRDWKNQLTSAIQTSLNDLNQQDTITTQVTIKETQVSNTGDCRGTETTDASCGYESCTSSAGTYNCGCSSVACCINPTSTTACKKYTNVVCSYDYFGAVKVLVEVTDSNAYPVYDGTTDYRNIKLNFYLISSNDYSQKPIQP